MLTSKSQFGFFSIPLLLGVAILALILITGGYYLHGLFPRWVTYTNNDYGFSLKYPEGWIVQEIKENKNQYQIYIEHPSDVERSEFPGLYIYVWSSGQTDNNTTNTTVDGITATRQLINDNSTATHDAVTFTRNDYLYEIGMHYHDGKRGIPQNKYDKQVQGIFNKLLSTFKFIDGKPNTGSACVNDEAEILSLIDKFENLQKEKKAIEVLGLFTPPLSWQEIEKEIYLSGKKNIGVPNLYGNITANFNLTDYKIIDGPTPYPGITNTCTVNIEEQRSYDLSSGDNIVQAPPVSKETFSVIRQGNKWVIESYYFTDQIPGKYSAWEY